MSGSKGKKGVVGSFSRGLVPEIDGLILAELPAEGTMIGGVRPMATNAKTIAKRTNGALTSGEISGRLRVLELHGMVAKVQLVPVSQGLGYQITGPGASTLNEWRSK